MSLGLPRRGIHSAMQKYKDPIPELKQELRREILDAVGKYAQYVAASAIGTDQPRMSDLHRGHLERFSLETLIRFLARIERRVELNVVVTRLGAPRIFHFPNRR